MKRRVRNGQDTKEARIVGPIIYSIDTGKAFATVFARYRADKHSRGGARFTAVVFARRDLEAHHVYGSSHQVIVRRLKAKLRELSDEAPQ